VERIRGVSMTPDQQRAIDLQERGYSRAQIAVEMGISEHAVKRRLAGARKWLNADPAATHAAQVAGSNAIPHSFWVKSDTHSVYYQTPKDTVKQDILSDIADAFKDIPAYVPTHPQETRGNLMTVYPLMDAHFGMRAWARETGDVDYDLAHAERDIKQAFANLWVDTPNSQQAVLILGGDTLHADDNRAETPASGHSLDVDGRQYKAAEVAIRSICWVIDGLAQKHGVVTVRVLRGNHDPHAHMILHFALSARYRDTGNIVIEDAARDLYWIRHGNSLVASHHGDKGHPQRLAMHLADTCPEWSVTRDRHILTGHIHHDSIKDFPGVKWWSLRAFCPPDEYGASFSGRRALQSLTFDDKRGLKMHLIEGIYRNG
jgi:hypothetical protein